MLLVGGADVVIITDIQVIPGLAKAGADLVYELFDRQSRRGCGVHDFVAVLVGAGLKPDFLPQEAVKTGQGISHDRGVSMADVGLGVDVIDGRGDVISHRQVPLVSNQWSVLVGKVKVVPFSKARLFFN
jgi:hypothetical protein